MSCVRKVRGFYNQFATASASAIGLTRRGYKRPSRTSILSQFGDGFIVRRMRDWYSMLWIVFTLTSVEHAGPGRSLFEPNATCREIERFKEKYELIPNLRAVLASDWRSGAGDFGPSQKLLASTSTNVIRQGMRFRLAWGFRLTFALTLGLARGLFHRLRGSLADCRLMSLATVGYPRLQAL